MSKTNVKDSNKSTSFMFMPTLGLVSDQSDSYFKTKP